MEAAVIGSAPDERISHPSNLCGDSDVGFAFTVCAARIASCAALELGPEAVFAHAYRNAGGHPKDSAESRVVAFESREAAEQSRLFRGEIESAELQELPVMS
jgi:hypothetical protein